MIKKGDKIFLKNKKAQFYIIAAVVISGIIVMLALVLNVSDHRDFDELYDLGEELKIESEKVMDYGVYNSLSDQGIRDLTKNFTEIYTDYKGDKKDLYFVFGNSTRITVAGYVGSERDPEDVSSEVIVKEDDGSSFGSVEIRENEGYVISDYPLNTDSIIIEVDDIEYSFDLGEGEYFYFVINKKIGGQHYIVSNDEKS